MAKKTYYVRYWNMHHCINFGEILKKCFESFLKIWEILRKFLGTIWDILQNFEEIL